MRRTTRLFFLMGSMLISAGGCDSGGTPGAAATPDDSQVPQVIDWQAVETAMGRAGTQQPRGVHRFGMPRADLSVTVRGVSIEPTFALGSWLAMMPSDAGHVVAMGDLVLLEEELGPVLEKLQAGGVSHTAIHKHLPEHSPAVWWMHVGARGDPVQIATIVREALELTGTPQAVGGGGEAADLALDTSGIREALGHAGRDNSGIYSVSVERAEAIRAMGIEVPPSMGISTAINFQSIGAGRAAVNGDFVMIADEIDPVARALVMHGIEVVALHNHLVDEEPRLFFLHFWAQGEAVALARGLRAALDYTSTNGAEVAWTFDEPAGGEPPAGWRIEQTNPRDDPARWAVTSDSSTDSGNQTLTLADPGDAEGSTYNVAWTDEVAFRDGRLEVRVRAGSGREDQGGGPVWRVQDRDNYYIARWNPLEDNFRLYYVRNGERRQLESANVDLSAEDWHTLAIETRDDRITGYLNGRRMWETTDDTFSRAGGVGVWTKADAATSFDDLRVSGGIP